MTSFAQYAQEVPSSPDHVLLKLKGCRVYADGVRLNKHDAALYFADMNGVDRSKDYLRYRRAYNAGVGLTVTGSIIAGAGCGLTVVGGVVAFVVLPFAMLGEDESVPAELLIVPKIGGYTTLAGVAFLAAGIPTLCVYKSRIKGMVSDYNSAAKSPKVQLSFGGQPSGLGFALKF